METTGTVGGLCQGGCGLEARARTQYHAFHTPSQGGCPPRRICACPCGQEFQPGRRETRYLKGHHNTKPGPGPSCAVCGVPKRRARSRLCKKCYLDTLRGNPTRGLADWQRLHPNEARQIASRAGAKGWRTQGVTRATVVRVLQAKGIRYQDVAKDLGISRCYAQALLKEDTTHRYMVRGMAERLLRYAAGMPFAPTRQQMRDAKRADLSHRRRVYRAGGKPVPKTPSIVAPGLERELRENTAHLKKPKEQWFKP